MSAAALLETVRRSLDEAGVPDAAAEAKELIARALGCRRNEALLRDPETFTADQQAALARLLRERRTRRPLAYVLGEWSFAGLDLRVTPEVLVPRPETEELFFWVVGGLESLPAPRIADVGTGSGCLAVALAVRFPAGSVTAVDVSSGALDVARWNAKRHGAQRIEFRQADLLDGSPGPYDAVVANLPYVAGDDIEGLEPEVRHEPRVALDGGPDGLDLVRRLAPQAFAALAAGGKIFLEVGYNQTEAAAAELARSGFAGLELRRDMQGAPRFVKGVKP